MVQKKHRVVILGAGITGLTLAHKLARKGVDFVVIDTKDRPGGVVETKKSNGFVYESGPNSGVVSHPEVVALFDELGDAIELEKGNDLVKTRYVMKRSEWHALPSSPLSAITTPLFSVKDKFRVLGEPFRKPGTNPDESLADMVKRRLGKSFLDYAIDPFILGIYAGDPAQLVPRYALPKLYNLEQTYGSFIKGAIKKSKLPKTELEKRTDRAVFSFKGGLSQLVSALHQSAGHQHFVFKAEQVEVMPDNDGFIVHYKANGETIQVVAEHVVTTFGSVGLRRALPFVDEVHMQHLTNLKYARVVEIALGFKHWEGFPLNGFGGLIPHKEKRDILGVLFMSSLFTNRAPKGGATLSVFMGGVRNEKLCDLNDDGIMDVLAKELRDVMKLPSFNPDMVDIMRYATAIPQYGVNSGQRFDAIETVEKLYPGLHIAGNLKDGIGMADRIKQASVIAEIF